MGRGEDLVQQVRPRRALRLGGRSPGRGSLLQLRDLRLLASHRSRLGSGSRAVEVLGFGLRPPGHDRFLRDRGSDHLSAGTSSHREAGVGARAQPRPRRSPRESPVRLQPLPRELLDQAAGPYRRGDGRSPPPGEAPGHRYVSRLRCGGAVSREPLAGARERLPHGAMGRPSHRCLRRDVHTRRAARRSGDDARIVARNRLRAIGTHVSVPGEVGASGLPRGNDSPLGRVLRFSILRSTGARLRSKARRDAAGNRRSLPARRGSRLRPPRAPPERAAPRVLSPRFLLAFFEPRLRRELFDHAAPGPRAGRGSTGRRRPDPAALALLDRLRRGPRVDSHLSSSSSSGAYTTGP